jgi:hypothetical protein
VGLPAGMGGNTNSGLGQIVDTISIRDEISLQLWVARHSRGRLSRVRSNPLVA